VNVSPVLRLMGRIHSVGQRHVPAVAAAEAERDPETGRIVRDAVEARDAYDVFDVVVHTDRGGYALVVARADALEGTVPEPGESVDWPVRNYIVWSGRAGRRFPTVGVALAGEVYRQEQVPGGARRAESPAA